MTKQPMALVPVEPTEEMIKATRELITECDFLLIGLSMSDPENLDRAPPGARDVLPTFLPALRACLSALENMTASPNAGKVSREQIYQMGGELRDSFRPQYFALSVAMSMVGMVAKSLGLSIEGEEE